MIEPKEVLIPIPGFYGYRHSLNAVSGVNIREYQLKEENGFDLNADFADEITETTDLIILANPNNPTGRAISPKVLDPILEKCRKTGTYVLIDECFLHLTEGAVSAAAHISETPGLFIVNAYTKLFSIPGVRIGYAMSSPENIEKLRTFLPEWNMSAFALKAGCACADYIRDTDYVKDSILRTTNCRHELTALLEKQDIKVYPSDTCYVLLRAEDDLYNKFLDKKILIRDCSDFAGLSTGYYRIAVSGSDVIII
jgi:histidinol-phosphate/aromatic aminotransferase/cobyric acid decarboxylase-like protein